MSGAAEDAAGTFSGAAVYTALKSRAVKTVVKNLVKNLVTTVVTPYRQLEPQ
ncbi:hypothetical protein GCM10027217_32900 [Pseudomaricurvus hydrocarbonicus]